MKGIFPCTTEMRMQNCTREDGSLRSQWSNSSNRLRICLGCPILRLTIEEKSVEDIAMVMRMDPHTAAVFRNAILWRLNDNDGYSGYYQKPFIRQNGSADNVEST